MKNSSVCVIILNQFVKQDLCPNSGVEVPGVRGINVRVYVRK
jgi:hypothetical protein